MLEFNQDKKKEDACPQIAKCNTQSPGATHKVLGGQSSKHAHTQEMQEYNNSRCLAATRPAAVNMDLKDVAIITISQ